MISYVIFLILVYTVLLAVPAWFVVLVVKTFLPAPGETLRASLRRMSLGWGLWGLLVVFLLVIWPSIAPHQGAARRSYCMTHLRHIGVAMLNYHDAHGQFPPAYTVDNDGQRLHSWRVLLLPYLEHANLYDRIRLDEPWDSLHNRALLQSTTAPEVYRCPSSVDDVHQPNYVRIVGQGAVTDGPTAVALGDISDGPAYTVLVVEVTAPGFHWAEPRDLAWEEMTFRVNDRRGTGISSNHPGIANVGFCDGLAAGLLETAAPDFVRAILTINGSERIDGDFEDQFSNFSIARRNDTGGNGR